MIVTNNWLLNALCILKDDEYYYRLSINTAYYSVWLFYYSELYLEMDIKNLDEVLIAELMMNLGECIDSTIPRDDMEKIVIEYIEKYTKNENVKMLIRNHSINFSEIEKLEISSIELKTELKLLVFSSELAKILDSIREGIICNQSPDEIKAKLKSSLDILVDSDDKLINSFLDFINNTISLTDYICLELDKKKIICNKNYLEGNTTPIKQLIDVFLDENWIFDILSVYLKLESDDMEDHHLTTAMYSAALVVFGNYGELVRAGYDINDVFLGAMLHDIGYLHEERNQKLFFLRNDLSQFETQLDSEHVNDGIRIVNDYFKSIGREHNDLICKIIHDHHERVNGSGYYNVVETELILPLVIVSLADKVDTFFYNYTETEDLLKELKEYMEENYMLDKLLFEFDKKMICRFMYSVSNYLHILKSVFEKKCKEYKRQKSYMRYRLLSFLMVNSIYD